MEKGKSDNKYRKVLLMAQRAKQIRNGARPRVLLPGSRATRIAREEVERGLIGFDYVIPSPKEKR